MDRGLVNNLHTSEILRSQPKVINIGIVEFAEALKEQGIDVVHVDWKPPAEDDKNIMDLLDEVL